MDVPWPILAKATFCKVYTNISVGNFANEIRILELLKKISDIDAITFRALIKPKKITRHLFGKFISSEYNVSNNVSISDAFSLDITGVKESLVILRVKKGILGGNSFIELFIISIVQDKIIVWNNSDIFTKIETFIFSTFEIYREQIALNNQSAEVGNQIIELLQAYRLVNQLLRSTTIILLLKI